MSEHTAMPPVSEDVEISDNIVNSGQKWTLGNRALEVLVINDKSHEEKFKAVLAAQQAYKDAIAELNMEIMDGIQFKFESDVQARE